MELWLKKSLELVEQSIEDIEFIDYRNLIYVFYEYFSNRNLATFIATLYHKNYIDIYFEIDQVIAHKNYNTEVVMKIIEKLKQQGFPECFEENF